LCFLTIAVFVAPQIPRKETALNPHLELLHPYPFQRLRQLLAGVTPPADKPHINLSIGEPKHPTPEVVKQALIGALDGWPPTPPPWAASRCAAAVPTGWPAATR